MPKGPAGGQRTKPSTAERQLRQAAKGKRGENAGKKQAHEISKLKAELEELRKASAGKADSPAKPADDMDLDGGSGQLDEAVSAARIRLKHAKDMPESVRDLLAGGHAACLAKVQAEYDAALAARRAANPLKKQLEGAETHKARMVKKLEETRAVLQEQLEAVDALNRQMADQKVLVAEAEAASAKATAEVSALVAQYASERTDPDIKAAGCAGGPAVVPAGCVSLQFAEEQWAEREAAFAQQMAQLQALLGHQPEGTNPTPSEATPSVAGDVGSIDDLEDDNAWQKVAKEKRKGLLRRERDALASKLRTSLGKVATHTSPFNKKG